MGLIPCVGRVQLPANVYAGSQQMMDKMSGLLISIQDTHIDISPPGLAWLSLCCVGQLENVSVFKLKY